MQKISRLAQISHVDKRLLIHYLEIAPFIPIIFASVNEEFLWRLPCSWDDALGFFHSIPKSREESAVSSCVVCPRVSQRGCL